jgi:hypothetical protein
MAGVPIDELDQLNHLFFCFFASVRVCSIAFSRKHYLGIVARLEAILDMKLKLGTISNAFG